MTQPPEQFPGERPTEPIEGGTDYTSVFPRYGGAEVFNTLHRLETSPLPPSDQEATAYIPVVGDAASRLVQGALIARAHHDIADELRQRTDNLRLAFVELDERQRIKLEPYLERCANTVYSQRQELRPERGGLLWSEWLATEAQSDELIHFSKVHKAELETQAKDPAVAEAFAAKQNEYIANIEPWIAANRFSPNIRTQVRRLQNAKMKLSDVWESAIVGTLAYHVIGSDEIGISQGIIWAGASAQPAIVRMVNQNTIHELDHMANGMLMPTILSEALAEHIALSMSYGDFESTNPADRNDEEPAYTDCRGFVHFLATEGAEPIPIDVWTRAHSSQSVGSPEYRDFENRFMHAWDISPQQACDEVALHEADLVEREEQRVQADPGYSRQSQLRLERKAIDLTVESMRAARTERPSQQQDTAQAAELTREGRHRKK